MLRRMLAGAVGVLAAGNGIAMVLDSAGWFARVPGVVETGPYNPHLVLDVGLAFTAAGGALLAFARWPRLWPAALAGASFLGLHAGLHLAEMVRGHNEHIGFDLLLVVVPALVGLAVAWPKRDERHAVTDRA